MKLGNLLPQYFDMIEKERKKFFPNNTIDCPFKPGKFYATNISLVMGDDKEYGPAKPYKHVIGSGLGLDVSLPNGRYRYTIKISSKTDPYIFFLQWQLEVRIRMNDDHF
jgi:hypothetical protein